MARRGRYILRWDVHYYNYMYQEIYREELLGAQVLVQYHAVEKAAERKEEFMKISAWRKTMAVLIQLAAVGIACTVFGLANVTSLKVGVAMLDVLGKSADFFVDELLHPTMMVASGAITGATLPLFWPGRRGALWAALVGGVLCFGVAAQIAYAMLWFWVEVGLYFLVLPLTYTIVRRWRRRGATMIASTG
jgi:hypothetical protein